MDKFGAIRTGYTPPRQGTEKTVEELEDTIEKRASEKVEARREEQRK